MIKWIKGKFSSVISVCFILYVILISVSFAISGVALGKAQSGWTDDFSFIGLVLGLIIGIAVALLSGILTFGFFATIISISQSNDLILKKIDRIEESIRSAKRAAE